MRESMGWAVRALGVCGPALAVCSTAALAEAQFEPAFVDAQLEELGIEGGLSLESGLVPISAATLDDTNLGETLRRFMDGLNGAERRLKEDAVYTEAVHDRRLGVSEATFTVVAGRRVFEGDMVLGDEYVNEPNPLAPTALLGLQMSILGADIDRAWSKWWKSTIPYCMEAELAVGGDLALAKRVRAAVREWNEALPSWAVHFKQTADAADHKGWCPPGKGGSPRVRFSLETHRSDICHAEVGRWDRREQYIWLGWDCDVQHILHEMAHAAGMLHEQSRQDRDQWVEIIRENIESDAAHNFDQERLAIDRGEYDYTSLMHYRLTQFSSNGGPTIRVLRPDRIPEGFVVGEARHLSTGDIAAIKARYPEGYWSVPLQLPELLDK